MNKCENLERNKENCPCKSETCERLGKCCDCIAHHRNNGGLPACLR